MFKKTTLTYLSVAILSVTAVIGVLAASNSSPFTIAKEESKSNNIVNVSQESEVSAGPRANSIKVISAGEADTIIYEGIDDLEQGAQIIVEATIVGEQSTENYVQNGEVLETYGVANVEISKVYKGDVKVGDVIPVAEPGYFDDKGNYVSFEGYKVMEDDGRYLLFMTTSKSGNHVLLGLFQGKFDLNIKEEQQDLVQSKLSEDQFAKSDYVGEDAEQFNKLKAGAIAKFAPEEKS